MTRTQWSSLEGFIESSSDERSRFLDEIYEEEAASLDQLKPYRLQVWHRLFRAFALLRGLVEKNQLLADAAQIHANLFDMPAGYPLPGDYDLAERPAKLPLHPRALRHVPEIAERLQAAYFILISKLEVTSHNIGVLGIRGMSQDPEQFISLFPTPEELCLWELKHAEKVASALAKSGTIPTRRWLQEKEGYNPREAGDWVALARTVAASYPAQAVEERKGVMILRLESYIARARRAFDVKAEMSAMKLLATIEGLTEVAEQDRQRDMIRLLNQNPIEEPPSLMLQTTTNPDDAVPPVQ